MEELQQELHLKHKCFEEKAESFIQKYIWSRKIVKKLTDTVFSNKVHEQTNIQTADGVKNFVEIVNKNLDILMEAFDHCNNEVDYSFNQLIPIDNDLTLFTYKPFDVRQYKLNTIDDCVITKIGNSSEGRCYINDLKRPQPQLLGVCSENLTRFPRSGEIFAVDLGDQGFYRAVRSDLVFKPQSKIIVYLLDIGQRLEIPYDLREFYSLPAEYCEMESRAIPCKVIKLIGRNGLPLDIKTNLQDSLNELAYFQVKNIENNTLWIKVYLKQDEEEADDESDIPLPNDASSDQNVELKEMLCTVDDDTKIFFNDFEQPSEMVMQQPEFSCDICHSVFTTKADIKSHMNLHIPKLKEQRLVPKGVAKKKMHTCDYCCKILTSNAGLKGHLRIHSGERPYVCNICGATFSRNTHLKQHAHTHKITCKFCSSIFSQVTEFEEHMKKTHKGKKTLICVTCGKIFSTAKVLSIHMNLHTQKETYPCKVCGKMFFNYASLLCHAKIHSNSKFCCKVCGKGFAFESYLKRHLMTHSGEKAFACKICPRAFTNNRSLKTHLAKHGGN